MKGLLITFAILALSFNIAQAVQPDYYVFASIWAGTNCYYRTCYANQTLLLDPTFFNIHGLWPNYWQGYPAFCDNSSLYDPSSINLQTKLKMQTLWNGMNWTSWDFHDHEWTKHGTCWNDPKGDNTT